MKVCFIAGREPAYTRNAMLLKALRRKGIEVVECTDSAKTYPQRYASALGRFLREDRASCDIVMVGFFGQPLMPVVNRLTDRPIVMDAFLSAYDTMCFERQRFRPTSRMGRFFFWLDRHACTLASRVLLDTNAHVDYFRHSFGLEATRLSRLLVGADETVFFPRPEFSSSGRTKVFYCCGYLPVHGTDHVVRAAKMLERYPDIDFEIVGAGPLANRTKRLAAGLGCKNLHFTDWVPYEELPARIEGADICLAGHFSDIDKARRVIPGKTYQFIAMKKPIIAGDCPANRELFSQRENAMLVDLARPEAIVRGVLELREDRTLRERIAGNGYETFLHHCTVDVIGDELKALLQSLLGHRPNPQPIESS